MNSNRPDEEKWLAPSEQVQKGNSKAIRLQRILRKAFLCLLGLCFLVYWNTSSTYISSEGHIKAIQSKGTDIIQQDRLSLIAMWNGNGTRSYLRNFFYSAQLNSEHVDLIFINRRLTSDDTCIDFSTTDIDITWGGNVRTYCIDPEEWRNIMTSYLCAAWDCTMEDRDKVIKYFNRFPDHRNAQWRPLQGELFKKFLPETNKFWAFIDVDMTLGRMSLFPFKALAKLSWITFHRGSLEEAYFAGQFTAFNGADLNLQTIWKKVPHLSSVKDFLASFRPSYEEKLWSWAYQNPEADLPGAHLNYALIPDLNGDDFYTDDSQFYAISGLEILLIESQMPRQEIERLILLARQSFKIDIRNEGNKPNTDVLVMGRSQEWWTTMTQPETSHEMQSYTEEVHYETAERCRTGHWIPLKWRLCIGRHPLSRGMGSWRATFIHLNSNRPGMISRRLDLDQRPRYFSRKLFKHHMRIKHEQWADFPSFDISEDHIMLLDKRSIQVFKIGEDRETNIYQVSNDSHGHTQ